MNISRRFFVKATVLATTSFVFLQESGLKLSQAIASAMDSKIKKQGYSSTGKPLDASAKKKFDKHVSKVHKITKKVLPNCSNCKHFKVVADQPGYGKCAMVGATGKPGKFVAEKGWCKIWTIDKAVLKSIT